MRYRSYIPEQMYLLPPSIEDMIPDDSDLWMIMEVVNSDMVKGIDTSDSDKGNAAYNPLMMTRLLVMAYFNKIHSSREIVRKTYIDVEFLYIAGKQHPNFRTICNFRQRNREFLSSLYKLLYKSAYKMGLTKMGCLSIDGTHVKGNVSGKKGNKTIEEWKEIEKKLDEEIAEYEKQCILTDNSEDKELGKENNGGLPKEYQDKKKLQKKIQNVLKEIEEEDPKTKINLNDPDARYLKKNSSSGYTLGYNVGLAVDENQLIADVAITNVSSDQHGLKTGIEGVRETIGEEIPEETKVLCDAGYFSANNIEYLENENIDGFIAPSNEFKTDKFENEWRNKEFKYDEEKDVLICRNEKELIRHFPKSPPKKDLVQYKAKDDCSGCPFKDKCCPKAKRRFVSFMKGIEFRTRMTEKMLQDDSKKIYVKRKTTVEPTIGDIKSNLGLRETIVRGFEGLVDVGLAALCHNIKKLKNMFGIGQVKWVYSWQ